ncbi:hypothetical protein LMG33818_000517 [Halomonadaceae bacterium LMG 33818]
MLDLVCNDSGIERLRRVLLALNTLIISVGYTSLGAENQQELISTSGHPLLSVTHCGSCIVILSAPQPSAFIHVKLSITTY